MQVQRGTEPVEPAPVAPKTQEELDRPNYKEPPPPAPQGLKQSVFKCNYPGCDYVGKAKIGLFQHKKTHREGGEAPVDITDKKKEATEGVSE